MSKKANNSKSLDAQRHYSLHINIEADVVVSKALGLKQIGQNVLRFWPQMHFYYLFIKFSSPFFSCLGNFQMQEPLDTNQTILVLNIIALKLINSILQGSSIFFCSPTGFGGCSLGLILLILLPLFVLRIHLHSKYSFKYTEKGFIQVN